MEALTGEYLVNDKDTITFNNKDLSFMKPNERRKHGLSFIPEERIGHATISSFKLSDNFYLTDYINKDSSKFGIVNNQFNKSNAENIVKNYDVRIPYENPTASSLSGGNLQKFIVGREISTFWCGKLFEADTVHAASYLSRYLFLYVRAFKSQSALKDDKIAKF